MTQENKLKLYKHFCTLAEGDFNERTFDFELKAGHKDAKDEDIGTSHVGKMSQERRNLMQSDAKKNKEDMEKKYPELLIKKEEVKPVINSKTKSTEKK